MSCSRKEQSSFKSMGEWLGKVWQLAWRVPRKHKLNSAATSPNSTFPGISSPRKTQQRRTDQNLMNT